MNTATKAPAPWEGRALLGVGEPGLLAEISHMLPPGPAPSTHGLGVLQLVSTSVGFRFCPWWELGVAKGP